MTARTNGMSEIMQGSGYSPEELEFLLAMRDYMSKTGRKFPTFTEVLAVAKSLGYRRASDLPTDRPDKNAAVQEKTRG